MIRDLSRLKNQVFDLLIIGGGIYGASLAWEAASRGLSVALVEKGDFASGASANSLKIIHGGFRYLQSLDLSRVRASILERQTLMRIAPHLVHPLPVLVPARGHGLRGREALAAALRLNDWLGFDRNRSSDPQKRIPSGRMLSPEEAARLVPGLSTRDWSGGALFYDAQVQDTERLVLDFLHSAARQGAALANYLPVTGFVRQGNRVWGAQVEDRLSGERFEIQARQTVAAGGAWIDDLLHLEQSPGRPGELALAKAINLVVSRPVLGTVGAGFPGDNGYREAGRLLFAVPWRGRTLIGTQYWSYQGDPDDLSVSETEAEDLLESFNRVYHGDPLRLEEVEFVHAGLLPAWSGTGPVRLVSRARVRDYSQQGAPGLISVQGVKYTSARRVAVGVIRLVLHNLGRPAVPSLSGQTPLHGGEITDYRSFLGAATVSAREGLPGEQLMRLVETYGSAYPEVLAHWQDWPELEPELAVLRAQVRYAVREEMALRLEDVILRRTGLGSAGPPNPEDLRQVAGWMAEELGWTPPRVERELNEVEQRYGFGKRPGVAFETIQKVRPQTAEVS